MRKHEQDAAMQRGRAQSISTISGTRASQYFNVAFPYPVSLIYFCSLGIARGEFWALCQG